MSEYHKIQTVWLRDPETKYRTLLEGSWALPEFAYLQHNEWLFTEKVDGTNIRVMWDGNAVVFGGKTERAQIPAQLVQRLQEKFPTAQFAGMPPMTLYGEGYGAKIQKGGGNYRADQDFVLFDVLCGIWLERSSVVEIGAKLGVDVVPIVGVGTLHNLVEHVRNGALSAWGAFEAEGIVARPSTELTNRRGHRIITKLKHKDFALEPSRAT